MHWSEGMYRLFGRPAGSPVNAETYLAYVIEEDRPAAQRLVHRLTNGHQPLEETLRMAVRGEVRTLKIKYVLLRTPEGHPGKILGVDVDISEIKRLEQENLEIRLEQQNQLLNAVLDAQEAEQHRIAEALHNGVGQILYAAKLNLEQVDLDTLPANRERMNRALETGSELLTEAIRETRRVSHELVPVLLRDFGLKAAISDFCTRLSEVIDLDYQVTGITERLAPYLEVALYRISQELVNNIIRHSAATEASLMLQKNGAAIQLDVTDNGKGFDPGQAGSPGLGLRSIADRVKLLNGTFQLQSRPGRGVRVHIIIPTEKIST
jgi:signal transduction histidine kinase